MAASVWQAHRAPITQTRNQVPWHRSHCLSQSGHVRLPCCVSFVLPQLFPPRVSLLSGSCWALISRQAIKPTHSFPWDTAQFFKLLVFFLILKYMVYIAYSLNSFTMNPSLNTGISYVYNLIPAGTEYLLSWGTHEALSRRRSFTRLCRKVWENFPCKPPGPGVLWHDSSFVVLVSLDFRSLLGSASLNLRVFSLHSHVRMFCVDWSKPSHNPCGFLFLMLLSQAGLIFLAWVFFIT